MNVRVRPLNDREKSSSACYERFHAVGKSAIAEFEPNGKQKPKTRAEFDNVFGPESSTEDIFDKVGADIVESAMRGINGTIFAYGQTSSGKTFTMNGDELGDFPGILPLSALHIFDMIERDTENRLYLVRVSFVEIYNEVVTDLLNPKGGPIRIRESRERGVFVEAQEEFVDDFDALISVFERGSKSRHVGSTSMNERSSRSHTIFRITIESKERKECGSESDRRISTGSTSSQVSVASDASEDASDDSAVLVATLSLVDLAGSENARNTGAQGVRLREGGNINKSLLTLSGVIKSLSAAKGAASAHHRFRDSKLTRLLQPSLVGNCRTSIIACITAAVTHAEETRSTLRFASSAKTLKTKTKVNEVLDDAAMIKRLKKQLRELKRGGHAAASGVLRSLEDCNKRLEQEAEQMKQKNARVLEITRNLITGGGILQKNTKDNKNKNRKQRRRKKRETWCPSEMRANLGISSVSGESYGGGSISGLGGLEPIMDESIGEDDVMDMSTESIEFLSTKKTAKKSGNISQGSNKDSVRRMSFSGVSTSSHTIDVGGSHRRVSFGDVPQSRKGQSFGEENRETSISGMVLRSKGAKIASQAERLKRLEEELTQARKTISDQKDEANKSARIAEEQALQMALVKKVNDDQQIQISALKKTASEYTATLSILQDEKTSAISRNSELSKLMQARLDKAEASIESCEKRAETAEAKVTLLEANLISSQDEAKKLKSQVACLQDEANLLGSKVQAAQATYTEGAVKASEKAAARGRHLETTVELQASQLNSLQEVIIANEVATDKIRSELNAVRKERDALMAEQKEILVQNNALKMKSLEKIKEIEQARSLLKESISKARLSASSEIDTVKQNSASKDELQASLRERIKTLEKQVEEREEELADAVEESAEATEARNTAEAALKKSEMKVVSLCKEIENAKSQTDLLDNMVVKLDSKSKMVRSLQTEVEALKQAAKHHEEFSLKKAHDLEVKEKEMKVMMESEWASKTESEVSAAVAAALSDSTAQAEEKMRTIQSEAEEERSKLTTALEAACNAQRESNKELLLAKEELSNAKATIASLQAEKNEVKLSDDSSVIELKAKVLAAEAAVETAKAEAKGAKIDANKEVMKAHSELDILQKKCDYVEKKMLEMEEQHRSSKESTLLDFQAKIAEIEASAKAKTDAEVETVKERYTSSISALEKKIATLKEEITEKSSQVERLMNSVNESSLYEDTVQKLRSELQRAASDHEEELATLKSGMQKANDELTAQIKALKQQESEMKRDANNWQEDSTRVLKAQEKIGALENTIAEQKVRIASLEKVKMTEKYLQKFRKIKNQNEKLRDDKKKIKSQMKELIAQAKHKVAEAETRAATAEEKCRNMGAGADSSDNTKDKASKKLIKQAKELKEVKNKLREYFNRVQAMQKEHKKVASIIKQCCPDATANIKKDAGLVTRVARFAEVHQELVEVSEAEANAVTDMEARVKALQEKKAEDLRQVTQDASDLEKQHIELRAEYDKVILDLSLMKTSCDELKSTLSKRDEISQRTQKENDARIRFLEKENLALMLEKKKLDKMVTKKQKAFTSTHEDKENAMNMPTESHTDRPVKKLQSSRGSARLASEAIGSGHTMSETNEIALMAELMNDDNALLGDEVDAAVDGDDDDEQPECTTQ